MTEREGSSESERLDPAAVAALYARHADELCSYLVGLLHDRDQAAEVLQAAFAKAVEHGHTARDGTLRAWLFRVAHNEAMDRRRKLRVEERTVRRSGWWKRGVSASAEELAGKRETIDRIRRAIEQLPTEQREVVWLRIHEDKTFAEIATQLAKPLGTVLTRMRLATKKLAEILEGERES